MILPDTITTKEEAEAYAENYYHAKRKKESHSTRSSTFISELWERYETEHVDIYHPKETTARDIKSVGFFHLMPHFGALMIGELCDADITAYTIKRKSQYKLGKKQKIPVTERCINKELAYFSGFLTWCADVEHIAFDRPKIAKFKYKRPIPLVLTIEEVMRFLFAAEPLWRAYLGSLYLMGLRDHEAKTMNWEHIDWDRGWAIIRGKGGQQRSVPIPQWLLDCFREIAPAILQGPVFRSPVTDHAIINPRRAIERARKKAHIAKWIHPHLLRHSCITHLVEINESMERIRQMVGHARIDMTQWYAHVATAHLRSTSDNLVAAMMAYAPKPVNTLSPVAPSCKKKGEKGQKNRTADDAS